MRRSHAAFALLFTSSAGCATMTVEAQTAHPRMHALVPEEGRAIFDTDDGYDAVLTPYDLANFVRPNISNHDAIVLYFAEALPRATASPDTFRATIRQQRKSAVQPWTALERRRLDAMEERHRDTLIRLNAWLPEEIVHLKASTDRALEFGMPHTRHNAIIWGPRLPDDDGDLDMLFLHELFHVLSRHNKPQRSELYALVGFETCASVDMPPKLHMRRIPNPDAPEDRYVVPLPGSAHAILPRLAWNRSFIEPVENNQRRELDLEFLVVEREGGSCRIKMDAAGEPQRLDPADGIALIQSVAGSASSYYKHPEELLADNFALLFGKAKNVDTTTINRLDGWLRHGV